VNELQSSFHVSERRACHVVDQPRSSQRYQSKPRDDEGPLVKRMFELARHHPRFGYRRIGALLRRETWQVSDTRVYRLWCREGLKVPQKRRKRRRLGSSTNACHRRRAERINDVWAWDFAFDRTSTGSLMKWLSIVDEYTRECLTLKVDRSITSEDVIDTLVELFSMRAVPRYIRSDNGPEFVAKAIRDWLGQLDVQTLYIEPGSPWENGYAESFFSKLRDEFLALEYFDTLREARKLTKAWREDYNQQRPHSSLGYATPAEFAARCAASASVATLPALHQHSGVVTEVTQLIPS